jgi:hypothetical protein
MLQMITNNPRAFGIFCEQVALLTKDKVVKSPCKDA